MKIHHLLIAVLSLVSTNLPAQTKKIAFESHSGNPENFNIALTNDLFDSDNSNFGLPVPNDIKTYKLDSVIYVSDTVSVIVIREYRRPADQPRDSAKLWRVGKDTLHNDPLLGHKHSLDSIKTVLNTLGYYANPIKKVEFVGYDNKKPGDNKTDDKKLNVIPVTVIDDSNNNPPFDMQLALMLGTILLLSLLGGWLSWRFYQPRLQQRGA